MKPEVVMVAIVCWPVATVIAISTIVMRATKHAKERRINDA